ncbi:MAG: hypothetical protein K8L91_21975 [Anaerolineae bacterium]|nr:hypothetical protein [Anaerolineae bacterium]
MAKEAIETYLKLLTEEIADEEWVDLYGIGKIQVSLDGGTGAENMRLRSPANKILLGGIPQSKTLFQIS